MNTSISFDANSEDDLYVSILTSPYEEPARIMHVKVTGKGIVMDFYDDAELSATMSMTYEEWFDWCNARRSR